MANSGLHLIVPCVACGTLYRQWKITQQFCSHRCYMVRWKRANPYVPKVYNKSCKNCGAAVASRNGRSFCNTSCYDAYRTEKRKGGPGKGWSLGKQYVPRKPCEICGAMFLPTPRQCRKGGGKYCSNACRTMAFAMNPDNYPQFKTRRSMPGKRADLGGMFFRSTWEANYARYLNWMKERGEILDWDYECETFWFRNIKRGSRFYTPDFKLIFADGTIEFVEIKGYMDQPSRTKLARMKKYFPSIPITLIASEEYRQLAAAMGPVLPGWEGRYGLRTRRIVK